MAVSLLTLFPRSRSLSTDIYLYVNSFRKSQDAFRAALCDSFNTPAALEVLLKLVSRINVYISSRGRNVNTDVVEQVASWIGRMLRMFGLGEGNSTRTEIGWGSEQDQGAVDVSSSSRYARTVLVYQNSSSD